MGLVTMLLTLNVFILFVFLIYSIHTLLKKRATMLTRPHSLTIFSFCLLILQWILFLIGFYTWLPNSWSLFFFDLVWISAFLISVGALIKDKRSNPWFWRLNGLLTIFSFEFYLLAYFIGQM